MVNIKDFKSNLLKIDKKSYKNIDICYIGYITMKDSDYVKNWQCINSLHLITDKVDRSIKEKNGNKYLTLVSKDKKGIIKKHTELWDKIESLIKKIDNKSGEYGKDFMKIKFNSDDNLPLNKILKLHNTTIVMRSIFQKDCKYHPQVVLDEFLYEL